MPRKPKPPNVIRLEGNRSRRPAKPVRHCLPLGDAPDLVANDPVAAEEWTRVVASLPAHHLADADHAILSIHCTSWSLFCSARAMLRSRGMTTRGSQGQRRAHPAVAIAQQAAARLVQTADRLGLDPTARARFSLIAVVPLDVGDDDPDMDLLKG